MRLAEPKQEFQEHRSSSMVARRGVQRRQVKKPAHILQELKVLEGKFTMHQTHQPYHLDKLQATQNKFKVNRFQYRREHQ